MKYQLHDCEIDAIVLENNRIIFSFPDGFYVTDENEQELAPLRNKLVFVIDKETNESLESYVSVRRIKRGRRGWKEISFKQFCSLFKKGNMVIHDEYDSKLTNWKMFQLNACTNWSNIELFITDILNIEFLE